MNYYILILILILKKSNFGRAAEFCNKFGNTMVCNNFNDFGSLKISKYYNNESNIRIITKNDLILKKGLNIDFTTSKYLNLHSIEFHHLKGIDLATIFFEIPAHVFVNIQNSDFAFYSKNEKISENDCSSKKVFNSFGAVFYYIGSSLRFTDCVYTQNIFPFIFKNAIIKLLSFEYFASSSLKKNYLKFSQNIETNLSLNSYIESIAFFDLYKINLNLNLLNNQVFKSINEIHIMGSVNYLQVNLFEKFDFIESIYFEIYNLQEFIHQGLSWLDHLSDWNNKKIKIT